MKRRIVAAFSMLLIVLTVAGCGSSGTSASSATQSKTDGGTITIKFSHPDPSGSVLDRGVAAFKKELESRSGGKIKVDIYPANQLGSLSEIIQGIQTGSIDMGMSNTSYLAGFCSDVGVFDMPFLFDNDAHVYRAVDGDVGTALADELAKNNINILEWWPMGFRDLTTKKNKKIQSVADFKGLTIRVMDNKIQQELFSALGASPVTIDWNELFTALQQGTCDAQENPINMIKNNNVYEVQHYVYNTEHEYAITAMMISPQLWNKLSDQQKEWVKESAKTATTSYRKDYETETANNLKLLQTQYGMEYVKLDKDELRKATADIYTKHPELAELVSKVKSYSQS